ncbi:uncharacterized protein TRAVEDRAFT_50486 [Trametes versicolor FP-101664 SS1]|uniref:uncharacterized protein n=1 Tax=Trametes versicolor (strain FP-101664) TaxID=717944 RepID=UPI0004624842|nr:uncharacterized protein TRAVEDRAFT_50486 [Trametes versicolor FP-101664 SS1]EIW55995.1 hypothetical protein TRAVEDRAFT_50486 [Trametes versicolor FP-101664 SS1]
MPLPSHGPSPSSPPRPPRRHVSTLDAEFQTAPLPRAPARRNASPARRIAPPRPSVHTAHAPDQIDGLR